MIYTGIGSRKTPIDIIFKMIQYGKTLAQKKYILRSGGAEGADSAFEQGCISVFGSKEIYLPWPYFNHRNGSDYLVCNNDQATEIAAKFHPAWLKLSEGAKKLHTRNVYQILGKDLNKPSNFVICWTPNGKMIGGTAQALRIAEAYNIPIFNLGIPETEINLSNSIGI